MNLNMAIITENAFGDQTLERILHKCYKTEQQADISDHLMFKMFNFREQTAPWNGLVSKPFSDELNMNFGKAEVHFL